jgi:sarcosine oxidase subunit beta
MAQTIANQKVAPMLEPFTMERFASFDLLNEMGATAASH